MGEIRRGGRHFGVFLIPVTHDALVTGAILLVAAEVRIPTQVVRVFRFDVGHRSDLNPATIPI
jgi:hypothetical protein